MKPRDITLQSYFERQIERYLSPIDLFIHKQTTAAIFLFIATIIALVLTNSPLSGVLQYVSDLDIGVVFQDSQFILSLKEWINSGLMALFFFLIGLELKREILAGKLRDTRQVMLIIMGAFGGMAVPALLYWLLNPSGPEVHGWAIPMATDTAFAVGVLVLVASRVSFGISIFLVALAIFDDIGAITVIAMFYTDQLHFEPLLKSLIPIFFIIIMNVSGVRRGWIYAVLGVSLWWFIHESGIHGTLAGLLMAIMSPARTRVGKISFVKEIRSILSAFEHNDKPDQTMLETSRQHNLTSDVEEMAKSASTPLQRWQAFLINPVGIFVLPLFALFNAGIVLSSSNISIALSSHVTWGIIAGLVIGKPLGIVLFTFLGLWLKLGKLPEGMQKFELVGAGILAGIGFTMSLFITALSFEGHAEMIDPAKIGILISSILSASLGALWLYMFTRSPSSSYKE
ncbi:Na+/H+ antiporter NhaA [Micavibrio aeruginosavorus]|uniref:Na+/H+ antiporter NhaA n=1 Tax=Micavibrio aeruginosavorus TaxID=349221 RepID=UPI003F4AA3E6